MHSPDTGSAATPHATSFGAPPPLRLVLPRHALDACIADWLLNADATPTPQGAGERRSSHTTHAALTLQPQGDRLLALPGPLRHGPPLRLPPDAGHATRRGTPLPERPAPTGLLLLHLAAPDEPPPDGAPAASQPASPGWTRWLATLAPEHRLASPALQADLLVCWLRADGLVRVVFQPGDGWAALQPPAPSPPHSRPDRWGQATSQARPTGWVQVNELWLPGPDMLRLRLTPVDAPPTAEQTGSIQEPARKADAGAPAPTQRDAAAAAALGVNALQRWQHCRFAVVGAGRAGSVLAHSLVRSGAAVSVIDPDTMSPHSLDGDLPPQMEGRHKVEALARQLRGLPRPGAGLDARAMAVSSVAAGWLLLDADIVVSAADNDAAALWANAWALALHKPLLVVATGIHPHGAEGDLRLLPPGAGCLACTGGFSQRAALHAQLAHDGAPPAPADIALQRQGSLRSWSLVATHAGLRMLEQMVAGQLRQPLFRRLMETPDGGLQVQDWTPTEAERRSCPLCNRLSGAGLPAVTPALMRLLAEQLTSGPDTAGVSQLSGNRVLRQQSV